MNISQYISAALRGLVVTFATPNGKEELTKKKAKDLAMRGRGRSYKSVFKGQCGAMTWREME